MTTSERLLFASKAASKNAFHVVNFHGAEGLSQLFEYSIILVSKEKSLDMDSMVKEDASLTLKMSSGELPIHGVLSSFELFDHYAEWSFYKAVLVPKLWRLTLTRCSKIFMDKSVKDFLPEVLKDGGLSSGDFELKLSGSYPTREYVCQYNQSHFDFASYWMERDGLYYYFDQENGGKLVVTDSKSAHTPLSAAKTLVYAPPSDLDYGQRDEALASFFLHQQAQPKKVLVRDYNYETPTTEIKGEAEACSKGFGQVYVFAENAAKSSEAKHLAKVRAESYACREQVFEGQGSGPALSGCTFILKDHFRSAFNRSYLATAVERKGGQEAFITSGLHIPLARHGERLFYHNTVWAIPDSVQFRAERKTPRAVFNGTMNAKIWTEGSDQYAQVDKDGRYKVQLPFDVSGRGPGKASCWIRMAQPYVGTDHGMHFPLHKGTEVLLAFIDGDPDRPVIEAVAPNPDNPSLIADSNQTECAVTTSGKNLIHLHDQKNKQMIHMESPHKSSWLRMGAAGGGMAEGIGLHSDGGRTQNVSGSSTTSIGGDYSRKVDGKAEETYKGKRQSVYKGDNKKLFLGEKTETSWKKKTELKKGGGSEFATKATSFMFTMDGVYKSSTGVNASGALLGAVQINETDKETLVTCESGDFAAFRYKNVGKVITVNGSQTNAAGVMVRLSLSENALNGVSVSAVGNMVSFSGIKVAIVLNDAKAAAANTNVDLARISLSAASESESLESSFVTAASVAMASEIEEV